MRPLMFSQKIIKLLFHIINLPKWFLHTLRLGHLAQSTLQVLIWNIGRLATQLAWMVLLARTLGPEAYGGFSGVAGLAIALSGIAGAGLGLRMYQDVARDSKLFGQRWGQAARALKLSAPPLAFGFVACGMLAFPQMPLSLLVAVALAELAFAPVVTLIAFAFASHGQMSRAAAAPTVLSLGRLAAVVIYAIIPWRFDLATYSWIHLGGTISAVALIWKSFHLKFEIPQKNPALRWRDIREGLGFASIWASGLALSSLDKTVSFRLGGEIIAGHYTAAQRFASVLTLPVDALVTAVMPRLFRIEMTETNYPKLLILLFVATIGYGSIAGLVFWWLARFVPLIIGDQFKSTVPAMHVLAFYVPVYCVRSLGSNILLGLGMKRWRFYCEIIAMIIMAILMSLLIPAYGAIGAAQALLIAEIILVFLILSQIVLRHYPIILNLQ